MRWTFFINMHWRTIVYFRSNGTVNLIKTWRLKEVNENQIQYHIKNQNVYLDLHFLVNLTASKKQSFRVKWAFKSRDHVSNSQIINELTTLRVILSYCFKQLPLNSNFIFELTFIMPLHFWRKAIICCSRRLFYLTTI